MSTDRDRDPLDDRLLRRALRPAEPVSADACLDAESLAAWASGTLGSDAADAVDRHLATCARCQALLATFAATEDTSNFEVRSSTFEVAPAVVPFRARPVARWIPLVVGTLAASLAIWMVWPKGVPTDRATQTMAAATPPPAAPTEPASSSTPGETRLDKPTAAPAAESKMADARSARAGAGRAVAPAGQTRPARPASPSATPTPVAPQSTPLGAPAPLPIPSPTTVTAGAGAAAAALPPPPVAAGAGAGAAGAAAATARPEIVALRGSSADANNAKAAAPARVIAEFSSPATPAQTIGQPLVTGAAGGGGRGGAGGAGGGGGARGALLATNRAARVNWRVLASGQVERSVTGGDTWAPVTISPPAVILNGAAPSSSVCWLVGRTGIVLLSSDGVTFRRVFFPDVSDLRSVVAVDEREATVTTTDGRVFKTDDGGLTWDKKEG